MNKKRIIEADFIRSMSIIFIIFTHLPSYLNTLDFTGVFSPYFRDLGLGMFIFLSGYLLYYNNLDVKTNLDILSFYKKRFLKIFPLYWLALILFIISFGIVPSVLNMKSTFNMNFLYIIIHFLGLEILLAPRYVTPMFTLWFVGLILLYYFIYPFLIKFSKNTKEFLFVSTLIYLLFLLIHFLLNIVEERFFEYYFIFITGILVKESETSKLQIFDKYLILAPVIFLCSLILSMRIDFYTNISYYFIINVLVLSFTLVQYYIAKYSLNLFTSKQKHFFSLIANSSYPIYLFHRVILEFFLFIGRFFSHNIVSDILILFFGLPTVFLFSHYIQEFEQRGRLVKHLLKKYNKF